MNSRSLEIVILTLRQRYTSISSSGLTIRTYEAGVVYTFPLTCAKETRRGFQCASARCSRPGLLIMRSLRVLWGISASG